MLSSRFISNQKSYGNKSLHLWNKLYPIVYSINIPFLSNSKSVYIVLLGFTNHQCKFIFRGYNIAKYEDYLNYIFHQSKHRIPFKQLFLNKFTKLNRFEYTTNIY